MPNDSPNFRLNTRTVYLTYPQCPMEMQPMLEALRQKKDYVYHAICRERHQDGQYHLHVMLQYATPVNIRNAAFFDIDGFHPNIQSARKPKDVLAYIMKDGEFIENWPKKRSYGEILTSAQDYNSFMDLVKDNQPKDFIIQQERLEYFADKYFKRPPSPYQQIENPQPWNLPIDITNWLSGEFPKTGIFLT